MAIKAASTLEPNGTFALAKAKDIDINGERLDAYLEKINTSGGSSIDDTIVSDSKTYSSAKITEIVKEETIRVDSLEKENTNRVNDISLINTSISSLEGIISASASEIGNLQYKETELQKEVNLYNQWNNKQIAEDGAYLNVAGFYCWYYDVSKYQGLKVKITTGYDAVKEYRKYAFYSVKSTTMCSVMKAENALSVGDATTGFADGLILDVPVNSLVVVVCSKVDDTVSCKGLIDRIANNEQLLANNSQILLNSYDSWYDAFKHIPNILKDSISYINNNYPNKYQTFKYIGVGETNKSDISYWRPDASNDEFTYALESSEFTDRDELVSDKTYSYRTFTYTFPTPVKSRVELTVYNTKWSGRIKAYDKNSVMIYDGYSLTLPPFVKKFTVENRIDVMGKNINHVLIKELTLPVTLNEYNVKYLVINNDGSISYPSQNPSYYSTAMFVKVAPGKTYIYAKHTLNIKNYSSYCNIYDSDLNIISTIDLNDHIIGSCDINYNKAFMIKMPDNAEYVSLPTLLGKIKDEVDFEATNVIPAIFCEYSEYYKKIYSGSQRYKETAINVCILGDSTSSTNYGKVVLSNERIGSSGAWVSFFNSMVQPRAVYNCATGGATVSDPSATLSDGIAQTNSNTYIKQIEDFVMRYENGDVKAPDYVFIVGCTNDEGVSVSEDSARYVTDKEMLDSNIADYDDYMESNFLTDNNCVVGIEKVDIGKIAGAIRYIVERSMRIWPNVRFVVVTPLRNNATNQSVQRKCVRDLEWIASRLSIPVIDVFRKSNMPFLFDDKTGKRHWLSDSYHPYSNKGLKQGAAWHGHFIAKSFFDILDYKNSYDMSFTPATISVENNTEYAVSLTSKTCVGDTIVGVIETTDNVSITAVNQEGESINVTISESGITKLFSFEVTDEKMNVIITKNNN